jgi:hypothetical protein
MAPILGIWASAQTAALQTSYESIATTTITSTGTASVTFSSIPQGYKHLQLRYIARSTTTNAGESVIFTLTDTNQSYYYTHQLYGQGSTVSTPAYSATAPFTVAPSGGNISSAFGIGVLDVLDYTDTNKYKTMRLFGGMDTNSGSGQQYAWIGLQSALYSKDTTAITSVSAGVYVYAGGNGFAVGSQFALYGIKG